MKIVINGIGSGWGDNGGTRTCIKCGEHLSALGADVMITGISRYTWHRPRVKIVDLKKVPPCDVVIATGYRSVPSTVAADAAHKFYYVRGYELWHVSRSQLIASFRKLGVLVNSEWQQRDMVRYGISSKIVYPGIDNDIFYDLKTPRNGVGALYQRKSSKRCGDIVKVANGLGCRLEMLNKHCVRPSSGVQNKWYNSFKVWFAPTELEGLHNPPIEASLAGCALVCTDHERSGMGDYAVHDETALVYPARDINTAIKYVKRLLGDDVLRTRLNRSMIKLMSSKLRPRKKNMADLLRYFESLECVTSVPGGQK